MYNCLAQLDIAGASLGIFFRKKPSCRKIGAKNRQNEDG